MRIREKNFTVYAGAEETRMAEQAGEKGVKKTVFAGNFGESLTDPIEERIAQKREAARKQATQVIRDQFAMDKEIEDSMEERRSSKSELLKERAELKNSEKEAEKQLEELKAQEPATGEEKKEWEERVLEKQKELLAYGMETWKKGEEIREVDIALRQSRIDMAKLDGMVDAAKNADSIMENASDQIVGMLMQDAREHIDEELKEKVEQAEKKAEEKEAQEEKLEKTEKKKEEAEALTEAIKENSSDQVKIDRELKEIMKENELLEEEIKGLIVDSGV